MGLENKMIIRIIFYMIKACTGMPSFLIVFLRQAEAASTSLYFYNV